MEPPIVRYARSARAYLAGDRRRVAAGAVLLVGLVWMLARSPGVAGGESRQEHLQDVQVLEKQFRENLVRLAQGIKRDRRQDLKSLVEQRKHTLEQIRAEVESLESMIDPQEDEQRIDRLMKSARPVDMKEYVVIPPVIHMTWKTKRLPHYGRNNYNTWKKLNRGYKIKVYDDDDINTYAEKYFPEFLEFWEILKPVQKADVFRYLVMWKEGGVYADIDVEPIRPVAEWMANGTSQTLHWRSANVILGWEMVTDREDWEEFFASQLQLCQWTFASSPGHELWKFVLDWMLKYFQDGNHLKYPSIIRSTGPGMFSNAVKDFLREKFGADLGSPPLTIQEMGKKNLHVGDILLLKKEAFAPEGMWGSEENTLVRHGFAGTWKKKSGGGGSSGDKPEKPDTLAGTMEKMIARMRKEFDVMQESFKTENKRLKKRVRKLKKSMEEKKKELEEATRTTTTQSPAKKKDGASKIEILDRDEEDEGDDGEDDEELTKSESTSSQESTKQFWSALRKRRRPRRKKLAAWKIKEEADEEEKEQLADRDVAAAVVRNAEENSTNSTVSEESEAPKKRRKGKRRKKKAATTIEESDLSKVNSSSGHRIRGDMDEGRRAAIHKEQEELKAMLDKLAAEREKLEAEKLDTGKYEAEKESKSKDDSQQDVIGAGENVAEKPSILPDSRLPPKKPRTSTEDDKLVRQLKFRTVEEEQESAEQNRAAMMAHLRKAGGDLQAGEQFLSAKAAHDASKASDTVDESVKDVAESSDDATDAKSISDRLAAIQRRLDKL